MRRIPPGRLAIHGGGSPVGGGGSSTPGLTLSRMNVRMNSVRRERFEPVVLAPERPLSAG